LQVTAQGVDGSAGFSQQHQILEREALNRGDTPAKEGGYLLLISNN